MPPTVLFAPGSLSAASVSFVRHACHSADRISRSTLLPLPAPLLVFPAEAALGDLQPVSITVVPSVVPSVIPSVIPSVVPPLKSVAATIRAVVVVTALSTRAVSVERQG